MIRYRRSRSSQPIITWQGGSHVWKVANFRFAWLAKRSLTRFDELSALDIFGGTQVKFTDLVAYNAAQ